MAPPSQLRPPLPCEPDYDSSCSSTTVPDSARSWLSNLSSFAGSGRSSASSSSSPSFKPHKAHQAAWDAMKRFQAAHGQLGLEHFRILRSLGSGYIGNVYLCQLRGATFAAPQCFYAMKVVDREAAAIRKNKLERAEMEKEILGMLDHPFLPTLYAEFEASHYSCLVMEFCPGGDLHAAMHRQLGKRFSIASAKFYAAEALLALEYLHMMGIIYRDLKPENVLVQADGHIMLSDFDLSFKCYDVVPQLLTAAAPAPAPATTTTTTTTQSKKNKTSCATPLHPVLSCFNPTTTKTTIYDNKCGHRSKANIKSELVAEPTGARSRSFVGTHEYLAPEVISGQGHGASVDWWALGILLYEMVFGVTPFKGDNNRKTLMNILKQPLRFPRVGVSTSRELEEMVRVQGLISRLLVKNPKKRIGSVKGSVEIKRHDFFRGVNWALIRSVKPPEVPRHYTANHLSKLRKTEKDLDFF